MLDVSDNGDSWRVMFMVDVDTWDIGRELWRKYFPTFESLPHTTKLAVATLSLHGIDASVPGIGIKLSDREYWLDDNEDLLKEYDNV